MLRSPFVRGLVLVGSWALPAAADAPLDTGAPHASLLAPDTVARLTSGDPDQVESALGDVRVAGRGGAKAAPVIVDLLRRGLPLTLTKAAVDTLGDTETEPSSETLAWYARDRNPLVRKSAVSALAKTKGSIALKTLRMALSDSDAGVRGAAALGLGRLRAKDAVGDLLRALDHNVPEAAASIGALCAPTECERLAKKLETLPFDIVTSGLGDVLVRPAREVDDETKLAIVARLRALGTAEVNHFLRGIQGRYPAGASKRVRLDIDEAVTATASSPGSSDPEAPQ
jgi:HEAT repeat protein